MFFRRRHPPAPTFAERLETLRKAGFVIRELPDGVVRIHRGDCAIDLKESGGSIGTAAPEGRNAGILMGDEIGFLVDAGFQKFFRTQAGRQKPATAGELMALHGFEEDLKQGLGQESYYNDSLGTVSTFYLYDRMKDRDRGVPRRIWE